MHNAPPSRSPAVPAGSAPDPGATPSAPRALSSRPFSTVSRAPHAARFTKEPIMSMTPAKIEAFERASLRSDIPEFRVGDTVAVHYKIVEGDKLRVQVFRGIVIKRHRAGARSTFTVRKSSFSVGVERTFPLHSPRLEKIELAARGI